tara:strand:- start:2418 stop:3215 length:798 start_codon:yes stop_codon:yes gene_type:complete
MANYQSVTVQETEEENVSLEKQAAMQDEAAEQRNQSIESNTEEPQEEIQEEASEERPEWLDEKFESPEDLAKAYNELQKKQSSPKDKAEKAEKTEEAPSSKTVEVISGASQEFSDKGELSDKSFVELEKAGISRDMVEAYIRGQESLATSQALDIQNEVGGNANYNAMADWASENMTDGDLDGFNSIVETGSIDQAKMAVKGLYAQYISAGGQPPELSQGGTSGSSVKPYGSAAQVTEAMRDPRYSSDPAFRQNVENRLAVSNVL